MSSKDRGGLSKREWLAANPGQPLPGSSSSSGSSGNVPISSESGKTMSPEAVEYLQQNGVTPESGFATWLLEEGGFGDNLNINEAKKLSEKWIDSSQTATIQNLSTSNLPDEAFEGKPLLTPGTPEYEDAWNNLSTAYFDNMQMMLNAGTEQEQAAAEYNWKTLKSSIEDTLNVSLSNDAFQAWNQLQSARSQFGQNNISGSGIENETIDGYLSNIRRQDSSMRNQAQSEEEANQQEYYSKFATPEQVAELINSNPILAKSWGLVPSDEIKSQLTPEALREKYPTMSDADINRQISTILDGNGNYRSSLYQKYMTGSNLGANLGNVDTNNIVEDQYGNPIAIPVKPSDTGYMDIQEAENQFLALNAPLADQAADAASRIALGSEKPTEGAESGTQSGTQFNQISNTEPADTDPDEFNERPRATPGSMLSSAS